MIRSILYPMFMIVFFFFSCPSYSPSMGLFHQIPAHYQAICCFFENPFYKSSIRLHLTLHSILTYAQGIYADAIMVFVHFVSPWPFFIQHHLALFGLPQSQDIT